MQCPYLGKTSIYFSCSFARLRTEKFDLRQICKDQNSFFPLIFLWKTEKYTLYISLYLFFKKLHPSGFQIPNDVTVAVATPLSPFKSKMNKSIISTYSKVSVCKLLLSWGRSNLRSLCSQKFLIYISYITLRYIWSVNFWLSFWQALFFYSIIDPCWWINEE